MAVPVVSGASTLCTMGLAPGVFNATAQTIVMAAGGMIGTIADTTPIANVGPCGLCTSMMNPTVASATAAALGVLTPMPCVPSPLGVWMCGPGPTVGGKPGLTNDGTLICAYGGSISFMAPGQSKVLF